MKFFATRLTRRFASVAAFALCAAAAALHPARAQAQSASSSGYYTYTLNNVTLSDYAGSGNVTGYFNYDPTTNALGSYDITTSSGKNYYFGSVTGTHYDADDVVEALASDNYLDLLTGPNSPGLALGFDNLTGAGTFNIAYAAEGTLSSSMTSLNPVRSGSLYDYGTDGTLVGKPMSGGPAAVPELSPAAAIGLMSILGAGALSLANRRRRSDTALESEE